MCQTVCRTRFVRSSYPCSLRMLFVNYLRQYRKKFTYDVICQLAQSLLDGTVFDIKKGLEDIQQLLEKNLLNKRMQVINEQKGV